MKTYTQEVTQIVTRNTQPTLLLGKLLAIYARQSTKKQVTNNKESYEQQTKDLWRQGLDLGWVEENIVIYIENLRDGKFVNASGRLRIDERAGLQALVERVINDEVKTVLVWDIDRLFRDEDMVQPAVFVKTCKEHGCIVLTMEDTFDFNNPFRDDRKRFLAIAQAAADYITKHLRGRMLPAKARVSMRGQADGRMVSIGYIVDRREFIDRENNPNYRKFIPYEPHATVVRWLFKRYRELNGNLMRLHREISSWPFVFPLFEDTGHTKYMRLVSNGKGYVLTKGGLASLLSNVVYIGFWYYKGQIVSKSNHTAIVDEGDFWYAFYKLSPYTIDGERNIRETSKVNTKKDKPDTLLDGMIYSGGNKVYAVEGTYSIINTQARDSGHYRTSIGIRDLDAIYLDRMFEVLADKEQGETIEQRLKEVQAQRETTLVSVDAQMEETRTQLARAERDKRIAEDEDYEDGIRTAIRDIKKLKNLLAELKAKQVEATMDELDIEECQDLLACVRDGWNKLKPEKRLRFIHLITTSLVLTEASTHFLKVKINWTSPSSCVDVGYIWRTSGSGVKYTDAEKDILRELYPIADRAVILKRLPTRPWSGIMIQASIMGLSRSRSCGNTSGLHKDLAYQDGKIIDKMGVQYSTEWPDKLVFWQSLSGDKKDTPLWSSIYFTNTKHFISELRAILA